MFAPAAEMTDRIAHTEFVIRGIYDYSDCAPFKYRADLKGSNVTLTSFTRPPMYGSTDMYRLRTRTGQGITSNYAVPPSL